MPVPGIPRQSAGLCDSSEFIDIQLASQLQWIDGNGMYMDNSKSDVHQPIMYDLVARGLFSLLLKLGSRGVGVYDGENLTVLPTYPVKVVDTTSAGDSFTAALTLEYIRTRDIYHACRYGNAVASVTVSRAGAGQSIPTSAELDEFISSMGITL